MMAGSGAMKRTGHRLMRGWLPARIDGRLQEPGLAEREKRA
jgi:hypothetical protein